MNEFFDIPHCVGRWEENMNVQEAIALKMIITRASFSSATSIEAHGLYT